MCKGGKLRPGVRRKPGVLGAVQKDELGGFGHREHHLLPVNDAVLHKAGHIGRHVLGGEPVVPVHKVLNAQSAGVRGVGREQVRQVQRAGLAGLGVLYAMDHFDVYCYSSKDRDLTVIYWVFAPVLVQDGEYSELTLKGDNEMGPFYRMSSLNLSGDELLTVGELESNGDDYFAAFDLDGNELARSSQPVGSFNAVMMKRPNGYLLDTGYVWELYGPDGTFLEKSLPVGERETLCQLCGDFCTFDVFLPLEENSFLAVGHHGKATEPDEPVVLRTTTEF